MQSPNFRIQNDMIIKGLFFAKCFLFGLGLALTWNGDVIAQRKDRLDLQRRLLEINDQIIPTEIARQSMRDHAPYHGALFDADSVVSPIRTAQFLQTLMCSYVSPASSYYHSPEILRHMILGADALLNLQHDDGTIDLLTTNFHSTPDLGFTIFPVAHAYAIMQKNGNLEYGEFPRLAKRYLLKAGDALSVGGIHTPNHRWVVSAALAWIHSFFPNPKYVNRVEQWLAEKIDIDPDGQYNERSTAVYTPITNRCLLDIARKLKIDSLYDVVRRNLDLTFYFVHSNGEIATESSNRQDKYLRSNMSRYYHAYNYMALHDESTRYSGMVDYIASTVPDSHLHYMLPIFMEDPAQLRDLPPPAPLPDRYHKYFKHSDMVRIREGEVDMSIITDNSTFFTFFKGQAALEAVRLSAAFFGKGQFTAQTLEETDEGYVLSSTISGPYYQPLAKEKIPDDTDAWSKVPRSEREQSEVQVLNTRIYVKQAGGKATIKVSVDGPENLPVTLELALRPGGSLQHVTPKEGVEKAYLAINGQYAVYRNGGDTLKIGPGVVEHKWTQLRGALPKLEADCLYFTKYAPCAFEFTIE